MGDPGRLTNGVDYLGGLCGRAARADRPFIFYPRLSDDLRAHQQLLTSAPWLRVVRGELRLFFGQRGVLGKYCIHLHLIAACPACVA